MADYPCSPNPARIREFLEKLRGVEVPAKVTIKYHEHTDTYPHTKTS